MTTVPAPGLSVPAPTQWVFARHETFHVRDGWLYKAMRAIDANPLALYATDAHHELGVGKNMLKSLLYWAKAAELIEPEPGSGKVTPPLQLSSAGRLIYQFDPFFEDSTTWWIVHIGLASNANLSSFWYWAFNEFSGSEFAESELEDSLARFLREHDSFGVVQASLAKDAKCFLRSYAPTESNNKRIPFEDSLDCPLTHLDLLRPSLQQRRYRFVSGERPSLPEEIVGYTLYRYRDAQAPGQVVLSMDELRWKPLSPGRLLGLSNDGLAMKMRRLSQSDGLHFTTTAGLNTVSVTENVDPLDFLRDYYDGGSNA